MKAGTAKLTAQENFSPLRRGHYLCDVVLWIRET